MLSCLGLCDKKISKKICKQEDINRDRLFVYFQRDPIIFPFNTCATYKWFMRLNKDSIHYVY
ncbi:hypothetical protein WN51_00871 [Melipona quadrifasciata]|uniref:Uncharacterized protein n=1 Tax=Melipona quadrifasciata TaxID=166423 RepID=A0A0M9ADC2_9HYME|nr:hypothetical protein WN51_00871 [Melipona quadrifasciata]